MPNISLYIREGCGDAAIEACMREITAAAENTLEKTLVRMVRISVREAKTTRTYEGGTVKDAINPTVIFNVGPGRSDGAIDSFMQQITEILHRNLGCAKEEVRGYILQPGKPENFCIGGKVKDYTAEVK